MKIYSQDNKSAVLGYDDNQVQTNIETKGNCFASFQHKHCFRLLSVKVKFAFFSFLFFGDFIKNDSQPILLKPIYMKLNTLLSNVHVGLIAEH